MTSTTAISLDEQNVRVSQIAACIDGRDGRTTRVLPGRKHTDNDPSSREFPRIEITSNGGAVYAFVWVHFGGYRLGDRFEFTLDADAEDASGTRHLMRDQLPYDERASLTTSITLAADRVMGGDCQKIANEIERRLIAPNWLTVEKTHTAALAESDRLRVQYAALADVAKLVGARIPTPSPHGDQRAYLGTDRVYGSAPYYEVSVSTHRRHDTSQSAGFAPGFQTTVTLNRAGFDLDTFNEIAQLVARRRAAGLISDK